MPNWCECELRVYGNKADLLIFKAWSTKNGRVLSEDPYIPYPKKFVERDERAKYSNEIFFKLPRALRENLWDIGGHISDGFNSGGYEWCLTHWGTKWGICRPTLVEEFDNLFYEFECAWSPCEPIIEEMGRQFPSLEFDLRYFEAGCAYNGILRIENGEVTMKETGNYYGNRGG